MSFQIQRGLFMLDFADHHSVLGVSIEADVKEIRKSYLKIARRLHPDSGLAVSDSDRLLADQLLSKMVNPAWEKLSQEKNRVDHVLILKLKGQSAQRNPSIEVMGSLAKQLMTASNPDYFYRTALQDLAGRQYEQFDQAIELTAQISELNLVYVMRREANGELVEPKPQLFTTATHTPAPAAEVVVTPAAPKEESIAEQYYRRAEGFMAKGNYAKATLELRDALKIEPNNSRCHSLMGMVYLRQNQGTMAKIHFNKALSANPQDPVALEGKQWLEQKASGTTSQPSTKPASKPTNAKPNGGLFGGLFGGKKK
ncbi:DnaJ domain-containing protein [Phormidesmis sp. 146-35]